MLTGAAPWRRMVLPGLFALACIGLTIFTWSRFGGGLPLSPKGYRVAVPLPQASNLFPGADVRAAGVTIGRVVAVDRAGDGARARVELDAAFAPLHRQSRAVLRSKTLLGEGFLEIAPGPASAPAIPEGGSLDPADIVPAVRLDDVLDTFRPATRVRLRSFARGFAAALRGRGEDLNAALPNAAGAASGSEKVLTILDRQGRSLQRVIAGSGEVMQALGRQQGTLRAAIRSADRLFDITAVRNRELERTVRALAPFLAQLRATMRTLGAANGDLAGAASSLRLVAPALGPALGQVEASAPEFRRLFSDLPATERAANAGLPALDRILRAASPALTALYPALREAIPVFELLAEVRDSAITTFAGVGQIHNGMFVGPGNRLIHYANGVITLWNETVGGWTKRLPSNRGNTYPSPGFLRDIATGLKSYDCRHTGNPDYLPPFGGTPPCVTQGAWSYGGVSRFYPHLLPSAP